MEIPTVIHLQGDANSNLAPLILIHAISGLALPYLALGSLCSSRGIDGQGSRPVYGISSPIFSEDDYESPQSLSSLAKHYVAIVQSEVKRHGPYLLGGWSMGGMIAVEMAQIFQNQGEEVQHITLIDSLNPRAYHRFEDPAEHSEVAKITYNNIARRIGGSEVDIQTNSDEWWSDEDSESELSSGSDSGGDSDSDEEDSQSLMGDMLPKLMQHVFQGLDLLGGRKRMGMSKPCNLRRTHVTLVKCETFTNPPSHIRDARRIFSGKMNQDPCLGWSTTNFRSFNILKYSAQHDSCFDATYVGELTRILRGVLANVHV